MRDKQKTDKHMTVKQTTGQANTRQAHSRQADNRQAHFRQVYARQVYDRHAHTTDKSNAGSTPLPKYEQGIAPLNCESRTRSVALGAAWPPANTNALAEYKLICSLNVSGKSTCPTAATTLFGQH